MLSYFSFLDMEGGMNKELTFSDEIDKHRTVYSINFKKSLFNGLDYHLKVGYYTTENLYSEDNFLEFSTSLLYNIQK